MSEVKELVSTVTVKGQVTIPIEVRRLLGVKPHDKVVFRIEDGRVELQPTTMSLEDTFGAVTPLQRPEDFSSQRDTAIEEHVRRAVRKMQS